MKMLALALTLFFMTSSSVIRTAGASTHPDWTVDLHTHLEMKPGMGWLFRGDFNGPLRTRAWSSRFSNQITADAVEQSGIGILVVALYANPLLTWSPRQAVRREIAEVERFVEQSHGRWIIARDPAQARAALDRGTRVIILSLERASWVLETEADLREFVDEKGIRIVTPLHLSDDGNGGTAFMKGYRALATPWRWFVELFHPHFDDTGTKLNVRGLTAQGRALTEKLLDRGVWIDLAHASDAAQAALAERVLARRQPLLYTHGGLRRFSRVERELSDGMLGEIARSGGIVGLCPSEDTLDPTPVPRAYCDPACPGRCDWGLPAFATQYAAAVSALDSAHVMVGSDFNGAVPHLHTACGTQTSLDREGLWNIGQMGEFWTALRSTGAPVPERLDSQIDAFLAAWARVRL